MVNIWEKAISILAGNLNLGLSNLITTVLFENFQAKAPRNNDKENTIVLHLSVHFKVPKKTQKKRKLVLNKNYP